MSQDFPESPFEPGRPVSPDNFKGRKEDINKIIKYLPKVKNQGTPEHFFITGKRGMGKTSFINYVSRKAEDDFQMIPIHINNGGGKTIDELIQKLLDGLLKEFKKDYLGKSVIDKFLNNINEFKVAGTGVSLKDNDTNLIHNIKKHFADFLITTCKELPEDYGIFIVVDDLNGLSDNEEFTDWYKGLSETLLVNEYHMPVVFTLISYPHEFEKLCSINESFSRMFNLIEIDNLEDNDIEEFFTTSFNNVGIEFEDGYNSIEPMVYFSWGMPLVMQQIGESVFWLAEDKLINKDIALIGVMDAAIEIGNKQIKSKLDKIRSDHYENILLKICSNKKFSFKKSQIKEYLSNDEKNALTDCLARVKDLGIIESIGKENSGEYEFSNRLFFVYFLIKSTFYKFKEKAIVSYGEEFKSGKISQEEFDNKKRMIDKFESNF